MTRLLKHISKGTNLLDEVVCTKYQEGASPIHFLIIHVRLLLRMMRYAA